MGLYVTFEGIDGCGKSTQAKLLYEYLVKQKIATVCIREPGSTKVGKMLRELVLEECNRNYSGLTEACLFLIDRAETYSKITKKKLRENYVVISDRGLDSSIAYQEEQYSEFISIGNCLALENIKPDLTFLIDVPVEEIKKRKRIKPDYYDSIAQNYKEKIRDRYLEVAQKNIDRVIIIDGTQNEETIARIIRCNIERKLHHVQNFPVLYSAEI
ncbi:dTMP kinase [Bacillus cereus group sp. BfR-BA-01309]|uniref:dTMP kinase n=1 Tax=Bacillus cereus group sp. BfR-BA-01309 TaxID=2920286 RepID=UPI001F570047|nr:dTMP kinase [Bacillus cereus group sp. BfR-BA-01309]